MPARLNWTDVKNAPDGFEYIYSLCDPLNPHVPRYVGRTRKPTRRLIVHKYHPKRRPNHPLSVWLTELFSKGQHPIFRVLETVPDGQVRAREEHWIAFFKPLGVLTNRSDGEGTQGMKITRSESNVRITAEKLKEANDRRKIRFVGEDGTTFESMWEASRALKVSRRYINEAMQEGWRIKGQYWRKEEYVGPE